MKQRRALVVAHAAPSQALTRGEAVDACKIELQGRGKRAPAALPSCVTAKLDAARTEGKARPKTGRRCVYSTLVTRC